MTRDLAAYGVGFAGLADAGSPEPPAAWPRWVVTQEVGPSDDSLGLDVWEDHARIGMPEVGEYRLDRAARQIVLRVRERWSPEVVVHPGLGPAATVIAHWMGRATFHAAAVLVDGRAWGLLGDKGAGKSTTAAHLVELGCGLLTDDLLVVEETEAFAGPSAVDLRSDAGPELGGRPLGIVGARERWRMGLPVGALSAPLEGWVALRWRPEPTVCEELVPWRRLEALDRSSVLPPDAGHLLRLVDAPLVRFTRPHAADRARAQTAHLLEALLAVSRRRSRP